MRIRTCLLPAGLLVFLACPPAGPQAQQAGQKPPAYHLVRKPARRVEAEAAITFQAGTAVSEWLPVAAAMPEMDRQRDCVTKMLAGEDPTAFEDASALKRPYLFADVATPGGRGTLRLSMLYQATLVETTLEKGPASEAVKELTPAERSRYTSPGTSLNFTDPRFTEWKARSRLARRGGEGELDYAYRVFCWIIQHAHYAKTYGIFAATDPLSSPSLEAACGGLSALFAATMRSEGLPARLLFGRYALPATPEEAKARFFGSMIHVKSEVYLAGIGWVPVEVPGALNCRSERETYQFFGYDKGEFLTLHVDDDLKINLGRFGLRTIFAGQCPAVWSVPSVDWTGRVTEAWSVTNLPPPTKKVPAASP